MWGEVYTLLAMTMGWTWEYIDDHMTLPRLDEMMAYWRHHPPLHVMVAAYLGVKPPAPEGGDLFGDLAAAQALMGGR